jgi:hypothetical protein
MVVRFAPRVPQFKQKRPLRTDYFSPKPDKVVLFMCHIWVALRNLRNPCVNPTLHLKKKSIFLSKCFLIVLIFISRAQYENIISLKCKKR